MQRWLITGASGLLAGYVVPAAAAVASVVTTSRSSGDRRCDLSDAAAVSELVRDVAPDVVVHMAGLTNVEACEREPEAAFAANCSGAANLAAALPSASQFVVISTDQVYPDTAGPHQEDCTSPVNVYGRSKLSGETAARHHPKALVLRTNLFGASRTNGRTSLSDFVIQSLGKRKSVTLFSDISFSPLHMTTLADLIVNAAQRGLTGVYNAGSRDGMTKAEFALAIARHCHLSTVSATIAPSTSLPARAPRARDLRIDVTMISEAMGYSMPTLEDEISKL